MAKARAEIEVFQGTLGGWYWRLRARNGRIVADGSESYVNTASAKRAARGTAASMLIANIVVRQPSHGRGICDGVVNGHA